jgi:hypothetical protein
MKARSIRDKDAEPAAWRQKRIVLAQIANVRAVVAAEISAQARPGGYAAGLSTEGFAGGSELPGHSRPGKRKSRRANPELARRYVELEKRTGYTVYMSRGD